MGRYLRSPFFLGIPCIIYSVYVYSYAVIGSETMTKTCPNFNSPSQSFLASHLSWLNGLAALPPFDQDGQTESGKCKMSSSQKSAYHAVIPQYTFRKKEKCILQWLFISTPFCVTDGGDDYSATFMFGNIYILNMLLLIYRFIYFGSSGEIWDWRGNWGYGRRRSEQEEGGG
jgi:hypothetical protein